MRPAYPAKPLISRVCVRDPGAAGPRARSHRYWRSCGCVCPVGVTRRAPSGPQITAPSRAEQSRRVPSVGPSSGRSGPGASRALTICSGRRVARHGRLLTAARARLSKRLSPRRSPLLPLTEHGSQSPVATTMRSLAPPDLASAALSRCRALATRRVLLVQSGHATGPGPGCRNPCVSSTLGIAGELVAPHAQRRQRDSCCRIHA